MTRPTAIASHNSNTADLRIHDVSFDPSPAAYAQGLTYTIQIKNHGPQAANDVVFYDETSRSVAHYATTTNQGDCTGIGTIVCHVGRMPDNDKVTITLPGIVVDDTANPIVNRPLVVGGTPNDPNTGNNTTVINTPIPRADLELSKTHIPEPVPAGGLLTYNFWIFNRGPDAASGRRV